MNVLITGASGFLGNLLTRALLKRGTLGDGGGKHAITSLTLVDHSFSTTTRAEFDGKALFLEGDLGDSVLVQSAFRPDTAFVFHLAAMVSGRGQLDFDGCLRTNLDGTHHILETCRALGTCPRLLLTSSVAVFGGVDMPEVVSDSTKANPQTTYGMTKLIGEILVNEYSRKGFVDGRTARLPTVFIRPGAPNAALSSFASGIFREPLAGRSYALPVTRDVEVPLLGYRRVITNLIALMECDGSQLGSDRAVGFPSTRHRVRDLIKALERVAMRHGIEISSIVDAPDPLVMAVVKGWPVATVVRKFPSLTLAQDSSVDQVVDDYIEDFGQCQNAAE
jgi:nucleoside-diphosphate-sugar epimerase